MIVEENIASNKIAKSVGFKKMKKILFKKNGNIFNYPKYYLTPKLFKIKYYERVIARLEIKSNDVVKGIRMEGLRKVGSPEILAQKYFEDNADEIILSDIVASLYNRNYLYDLVSKICKKINIPIVVGGGIRSIEDALQLLKSGADKITINTHAVKNKNLIKQCAEKLGSQCNY